MTYRINVTRRADRDLLETAAWIRQRSRDGADRWLAAFHQAAAALADDPESCLLAEEYQEFPSQTLHQFLFKTRRGRKYRGLFTVVGNEIRVLRVRGPGQDLPTFGVESFGRCCGTEDFQSTNTESFAHTIQAIGMFFEKWAHACIS